MSRKKKKLRFYNKNPDTEYYNKAMQKLLEMTMPKEAVEKALQEAVVFGTSYVPFRAPLVRYVPPKPLAFGDILKDSAAKNTEPFKTNVRCTECLLDITVMQAVDKDHGTIDCPNCKAHLHWSTGKNEKGDTVTCVSCGRLLASDPSPYVVIDDTYFRGI